MVKTNREILPVKEKIAQYRWNFEGRSLPMGIGCAWVSNYYNQAEEGVRLLDRTYEEGFRYYDTSRSYGDSELVVGAFLKHIDRKTIFLSTKSHFEPKAFGAAAFPRFKQNFYESFDRMGVDHIDLFLIHDTDEINSCQAEVVPFLIEQKEKGLIDYIGMGTRRLSAHDEAILTGAIDASEGYVTYSLLKRSAEKTIRLAAAHDNAYINASLLHFGIIKDQNLPEKIARANGHYKRELINALKMQALCREMGVDIVAASLQFSMFDPDVDMILNGIHRMSNIDSTIRCMKEVIYPDQWRRIYELQREDPCMFHEDVFNWYG